MKLSATFMLIFYAVPLFAEAGFADADAPLTESLRERAATAERLENWREERARLLSLEKSYAALAKSKRAEIAAVAAANESARKSLAEASAKNDSDARDLQRLSSFADAQYAALLSDPRAAEILRGAFPETLDGKTAVEKLRVLADAIDRLFAADKTVEKGADGKVRTGIFLRASGSESRGGIAELKTEGAKHGK